MTQALQKYRLRSAEPEAEFAALLRGAYDRVLVVPVLREDPSFLDGYAAACSGSGRALCIVVVNAAEEAPSEDLAANRALIDALEARLGTPVRLAPGVSCGVLPEHELLIIDRSSAGRALPRREGVGLARKIGCDVALELFAQGRLSSDWIATTDADATLPADYFAQLDTALPDALAATFAFEHVPCGDAEVDRATERYEMAHRYYLAGLEAARSPYAFHSIGSALAVRASAYAMAHGFPRRSAAEDFHLLQKVAKLGSVTRLSGTPVSLRSRASNRAPLGTGPAVARLLAGTPLLVAAPGAFKLLGGCLRWLDEYAVRPVPSVLRAGLDVLGSSTVGAFVERQGFAEELPRAALESGSPLDLARRLHTWFDGLRSRQFLHAARAGTLPDVSLEEAIAEAPFLPRGADSLAVLRAREALFPLRVGPALPR